LNTWSLQVVAVVDTLAAVAVVAIEQLQVSQFH
jgi:hypothetical protein